MALLALSFGGCGEGCRREQSDYKTVLDVLMDMEWLLAELLHMIHVALECLVLPHLFQHILHKTHVPVFLVLFVLFPSNLRQRQRSFTFSSFQNQLLAPHQPYLTRDPLETGGQQRRQKRGVQGFSHEY